MVSSLMPTFGAVNHTPISRSGSGYGKGFSKIPFNTLNTTVFAPIPAAKVINVIAVNIGARINRRITCRNSEPKFPITPPSRPTTNSSFAVAVAVASVHVVIPTEAHSLRRRGISLRVHLLARPHTVASPSSPLVRQLPQQCSVRPRFQYHYAQNRLYQNCPTFALSTFADRHSVPPPTPAQIRPTQF